MFTRHREWPAEQTGQSFSPLAGARCRRGGRRRRRCGLANAEHHVRARPPCCSSIGRCASAQPARILTAATGGGRAAGTDAAAAPSWLDGGSARSLAGAGAAACVAGEALEAAVAVRNPLALDLDLTGVRLLFEHDCGGSGGGDDEAGDEGPAAEVWGPRKTYRACSEKRRSRGR
jgi:hypothetical protein